MGSLSSLCKCYLYPVLFVLVVLIAGCKQSSTEGNVTIDVKIKGSMGEMVLLKKITLEEPAFVDSLRISKQGDVQFVVNTVDFDFYMLEIEYRTPILFVAEKDQQIVIRTDVKEFGDNYSITGSEASSLIVNLVEKKKSVMNTLDSLGHAWHKTEYSEDKIAKKEILDSLADNLTKGFKEWLSAFITTNKSSPASILAIYQIFEPSGTIFSYDTDSLLFFDLGKSLAKKFPHNIHVNDLVNRNEDFQVEATEWTRREKLLEPGNVAPDFDLVNASGTRVKLSSLKGKTVLLYFWDARKQECWDINQEINEIYKKYSSKGFELCGIYIGDDKQLLFNAISIDKLGWTHLFASSDVVKTYNVDNVPAMILIDNEGKILHRNIHINQLVGMLQQIAV